MSEYTQIKKFNIINKKCGYNECSMLLYNKSNIVIGNYGNSKFSNNCIIQNNISDLAMFEKLAAASDIISNLTYNYSKGNFDYIYKILTNEKYLEITTILYETRLDIKCNKHVVEVYNTIRTNIIRSFEGFMLCSTQYSNFVELKQKYLEMKKSDEILKDLTKLREYINELNKHNFTIFPESTVDVNLISINPIYMKYIETYGIPIGLNFEVDLLGKIITEHKIDLL